MVQKTKLKKAFNSKGVQISPEAIKMLDDEMGRIVNRWVYRCSDGNVKRLSVDLVWIALGRRNQ